MGEKGVLKRIMKTSLRAVYNVSCSLLCVLIAGSGAHRNVSVQARFSISEKYSYRKQSTYVLGNVAHFCSLRAR